MSMDIRNWLIKPHQKSEETAKSKQESTDVKKSTKTDAVAKKESKPNNAAKKETKSNNTETKPNISPKAKGKRPIKDAPAPTPKKPRKSKQDEDEDFVDAMIEEPQPKETPKGRGRGKGKVDTEKKPVSAEKPKPAGGRGRGGFGRGNFGARETPPHKGEKEVPEGAESCLAGLTFVISGTLDSLEREEAEDLIKRHGGRVTSAVSKKTSFLLADEDVGGQKSKKAHDIGVPFLTEDGLFEKIRASKPKEKPETKVAPKPATEGSCAQTSEKQPTKQMPKKSPPKPSKKPSQVEGDTWPFKHRPKSTSEITGNQSIVKQLKDWLVDWEKSNNSTPATGKGKKAASSNNGSKKAALLCGPPGIGKTTTARLLCQELGFEAIEVNASDNRGKADSKIQKGIGGSTSNAIKELVSNSSLDSRKKTVLIMDEVDGMSAGDRGGVADLIASIKLSKIPIMCICNDRYSQKLKSLINYCLLLSYKKPTKQMMAKRLQAIAQEEGLNIDTIALEELAERTHGDMRLALNQLQYMSLYTHVLKYSDIKAYSMASSKDEEMSPFSAVDKLMGFDGGRLSMNDRVDLAMTDRDLVPLLIQENYVNYLPSGAGKDNNGTVRMDLLAQAATSIADADIVNVQIRRYQRWQLSQTSAFLSSIIPAALMHGKREILQQGERNFNRFGGWLGKNSTFGKKTRLLEDVHVHVLAARIGEPTRKDLRLDYFPVLRTKLTQPLRTMDKSEAVEAVLDVMEAYSLTQEDVETVLDMTKFEGQADPREGVPPAVKSAVTRGYTQRLQEHRVKTADLLPSFFPGQKKISKKKARLITPEDTEEAEEVPREEDLLGADDVEEEAEDESQEGDEKEKTLDALKNSNYDISISGEETKGGNKKTNKAKQTKATPAKSASKGASTSKAGTKRKR